MTSDQSVEKHLNRFLISATLVSVVAAFFFSYARVFSESLWPDEALYSWLGKRIAQNASFMFSKECFERQPPFFPMLLSLRAFSPRFLFEAKLVCLFISLLGAVSVFFAGKRLTGAYFVGTLSAISLLSNHVYIYYAPRILADSLLLNFFIFFILLIDAAVQKKRLWLYWMAGFFGAAALCMKWSALLTIPILFFYVFYAPKEKVRLSIPCLTIISALALLLFHYHNQSGQWLPNISSLQGALFKEPPWYYGAYFSKLFSLSWAPLYFIVGALTLWIYRNHGAVIILVWFFITFATISLAGEKDPRFAFFVIPPGLMIMSAGFLYTAERLIKSLNLRALVLAIIVSAFFLHFCAMNAKLKNELLRSDHSYAGFKEAGDYIKDLKIKKFSLIAGSERAIRYFSGHEYQDSGGIIRLPPKELKDFKSSLLNAEATVFVIDVWEFTQPSWIYPPTTEKFKVLQDLGFKLVNVIEKKIYIDNIPRRSPVIFILLRE